MPKVAQRINLHDIDPISTTITRDGNGCIASTDSDYGYVTHTVTVNRDGNNDIQSTDHVVADA